MTGMARFRLLHICNTMDRIDRSAKNQYKRNQWMLGWLTWCWRLPRSGSGWRSSSPSPERRRSRSWCGACCSEWPPWPRCQTRRGPSMWRSRHRRSWPCRSRCPWGAEPRSLAAAGATPWCPSSPRGLGPKQSIAPRQAPRPPRIGSPPCRCRDRVGWRRKKKECMIGSAAGLGYCVKRVGNLRRFGIQSVSWMSWPGENQEIYSKTNKLIRETPRRRRRRRGKGQANHKMAKSARTPTFPPRKWWSLCERLNLSSVYQKKTRWFARTRKKGRNPRRFKLKEEIFSGWSRSTKEKLYERSAFRDTLPSIDNKKKDDGNKHEREMKSVSTLQRERERDSRGYQIQQQIHVGWGNFGENVAVVIGSIFTYLLSSYI